MPVLHIRLLGAFQIHHDDEPVTIYQPRQQSLLAYLILHCRTPQPRRQIAYALWPDTSEGQASTNLRRELHHLRQALPQAEQFLQAEARTLGWQAGAACDLDVALFEEHLACAYQAAQNTQLAAESLCLEEAVEGYAGELLPDCYDEWIQADRERLRQSYQQALDRLIRLHEESRRYAAAIGYAERLLRSDRFDEASYRQLMHLHILNDDRPSALRVYHACAALLAQELGSEPAPATQALYQRILRAEKTASQATALSPLRLGRPMLVGRQKEWQTLRRAWEASHAGRAQFVCLSGEPGIGKSRLLAELLTWVGQQGHATAYTRAYATEGRLAYDPISEWLRAESMGPRISALGGVWLVEIARLVPDLLANRPDLPPPQPMTEGWQRRRFFEALVHAFLAVPDPILLALDDLQWCDRETVEWLHYLFRVDSKARLLVVGTLRPGEVDSDHPLTALLHELRESGQVTECELLPLAPGETAQLGQQLAGRPLAADEAAALQRVAEGNPLFVEEMLRAGLVGGLVTTSSRWQELGRPGLPPKIQSVITSRLARLSANARALAEVAATSGRSFTFDILRHVSSDGEDAIVAALDELWQRRIVRVQGQARYDFSHDKIREATYAGISPVRVPLLHRRVARALEQLHAANLDPVSGDIAAHYAAAGLPEQAIPYYRRAIEVAQRMCAHAEALTYLTRAQALLAHLPETPERLRQELNLQLDLGISVFTLKGVSALETLKTYERAYQLAERVGDRQQRLVVLQALCGVTLTRGLVRLAYEVAEREVTLAEVSENPSMVADAHFDLGMTLFYQGQWGASREHIERRVALPDYQWYSSARLEGVPDGDALCRRHLAIVLWHLGYADRALARMNEAVALAQAQADPFNLTAAFIWSARLHRLRGEAPLVHTRASQAVALGRQQGFAFWLAFGTVLDGWALAQGTEVAAGVAETQDGLAMLRKVGAQLHEPECLSLLAEAHGWAGDLAQGLRCLDEALAIVEATGARCTEAEICRLQGELLRRQGARPDDVDTCFRQALAVAQAQGALALELRAALSLCRLWRSSEARALLAEVYGRFTEGWETRNLREAREMLAGV